MKKLVLTFLTVLSLALPVLAQDKPHLSAQDTQKYILLIEKLKQNKDYSGVAKVLEYLSTTDDPDSFLLLCYSGDFYMLSQEYEQAIRIYTQVQSITDSLSNKIHAQGLITMCYFKMGNTTEANTSFDLAVTMLDEITDTAELDKSTSFLIEISKVVNGKNS